MMPILRVLSRGTCLGMTWFFFSLLHSTSVAAGFSPPVRDGKSRHAHRDSIQLCSFPLLGPEPQNNLVSVLSGRDGASEKLVNYGYFDDYNNNVFQTTNDSERRPCWPLPSCERL